MESLPARLRPQGGVSRQVAVALGYQPGSGAAPRVLAKGFGDMAEHILELARENGIPVHEDSDLAEVLSRLDAGSQIPEELYEAIAEVLAFMYRMNTGFTRKING